MGSFLTDSMKVFVALACLIALSQGRPRFLVIPLEDVEFQGQMSHFPTYRMPALARQVQDDLEDSYQVAPRAAPQYAPYNLGGRREDSDTGASNTYAAPASPDHVDYGAYTGGYGAFGWYTDHPVLLAAGH